MDDAQAIETLRELEDKGTVIFLREYADRLDLKGHPVHASELRKLLDALPALSVVEAQLAEGRENTETFQGWWLRQRERAGFMSAGRPAMRDRRYVCMVFDEETGNAIDAFDYTEEALAGRLRQLRGEPKVTMQPNPWASLSPRREARDE